MRLYTFVNYYLSSIQQGIQSAHLVHELFNKYRNEFSRQEVTCDQDHQLVAWSSSHKTMVVLNGGNADTLRELNAFMDSTENPFAWNCFYEDHASLDSSMTCVGIVLPERIYQAVSDSRKRVVGQVAEWVVIVDDPWHFMLRVPFLNENGMILWGEVGPFTPWERELIERLSQFSLAK